jgi:hypothetical protein
MGLGGAFQILDSQVIVTFGTYLGCVELPDVDNGDVVSAPRCSLFRLSKELHKLLRPRCGRVAFAGRVELPVSEGDDSVFVVREVGKYLLNVTTQGLLLVDERLPPSLLAFMAESEGEDAIDGPWEYVTDPLQSVTETPVTDGGLLLPPTVNVQSLHPQLHPSEPVLEFAVVVIAPIWYGKRAFLPADMFFHHGNGCLPSRIDANKVAVIRGESL